jgi:IS605 OrfB family transposase
MSHLNFLKFYPKYVLPPFHKHLLYTDLDAIVSEDYTKERIFQPFWNDYSNQLSKQLWLPSNYDATDLYCNPIVGMSTKRLQRSHYTIPKRNLKQVDSSFVFSRQDIPYEDTIKSCFKIRIYPDHEQKILFNKCFGTSRYIYNKTIEYLKKSYEDEKKLNQELSVNGCIYFSKKKKKNGKLKQKQCKCDIDPSSKFYCKKHIKQGKKSGVKLSLRFVRPNIMKSDKDLTEAELWLKDTPYDTRQLAIKEAIGAYESNFALKRDGYINNFDIKFKKRNATKKCFHVDHRAIKIIDDRTIEEKKANRPKKIKIHLFVNRIDKPLRIKNKYHKWLLKKKLDKKEIGDSVITREFPDVYYLCIPYNRKVKDKKSVFNNVALDPGISTFQTYYSSEGVCGKLGEETWRQIEDIGLNVDKLKSVNEKTKKKEEWITYRNQGNIPKKRIHNNVRRTMNNIRKRCFKMRRKIKNITKDLHWKTANFLCRNFENILLPKFETQKMANKSRNKNRVLKDKSVRNMMSLSHYEFSQKLAYKAQQYKRKIIRVNEAWTSKTCTSCGNIKYDLGRKRIYKCDKCELIIDRDINGARNIMVRLLTLNNEFGV